MADEMKDCEICQGTGQVSDHSKPGDREGNIVTPIKTDCSRCGGTGRVKVTTCFSFITPVLTPNGWKTIGTFKVGDFVISYDPFSGQLNVRVVTKKLEHSPTTIWKVCGSKSQPVLTTSHHPFFTQRGWILTKNLRVGDKLLGIDENRGSYFDSINFVGETDQIEPVYNLHTSGDHTFIVSGYVVHNFAYFRTLRTWWHRSFIDPKESVETSLIDPITV